MAVGMLKNFIVFIPPRLSEVCQRPPCSSGKKKAHKHKSFWSVTSPVSGGPPEREARGQRLKVLCAILGGGPRNINLFVQIPDREDQ